MRTLLLRLLVAMPALLCLAWILTLASRAPEPFAWRVAWAEPPLAFGGSGLGDFEGGPHLVGFRLLHLGLLALPGIDFPLVPLVGWLLAACGCWLVHRQIVAASGLPRDRFLVTGAALLITAWAFSPGFGGDWLLDARFRVFVPVVCLGACLWLLAPGTGWRLRFTVASLLAELAIFTERSGSLVWVAAIPVVVAAAWQRPRPLAWIGIWCVLGNLGSLLCHEGAEVLRDRYGLVGDLVRDPGAVLGSLCAAAGRGVPGILAGSVDTSVASGAVLLVAALLLASLLIVRRREEGSFAAAAPWLAFTIFGIGHAVLTTHWFHPPPLAPSLMREMAWGAFLLPVGVVGLAVVIAGPALCPVLRVGLPILLVVVAQDWPGGLQKLVVEHRMLRQGEAQLAFQAVTRQERPASWQSPVPREADVQRLRRRGWLRSVPLVADLTVRAGAVVGDARRSGLGQLEELRGHVARGWVHAEHGGRIADLVVLTRCRNDGPERIFKIALPVLPPPAERIPWRAELGEADAFAPGERVRALAFDVATGELSPLAGTYAFRDGEFAATTESDR